MTKINKILKIILIITIFTAIISIPNLTKAEYIIDKKWSAVKEGDIIYFDNSQLEGWDEVQVYFFARYNHQDTPYKSWNSADAMTKIGDNLFSFTVTEEMEEGQYNMIIFKNGKGGAANQTIDLGFVEAGFVYKPTDYEDGNRIGYWYLYDKSEIASHLQDVKSYQADKEYYTSESYGELDELITKATLEKDQEIILYTEDHKNFYITVDVTLKQIDDIIDNLEVNKDPLNDLMDEIEDEEDNLEEKYTPDSIDDLKEEIEKAKELLNNEPVTVDKIKETIAAINAAKNNLVEKADKTDLEEVLDDIDDIDENAYTDESLDELNKAVEEARTILQDGNATQEEVEASVKKVQEAIAALQKKEESTENSEDDQKEDTTEKTEEKNENVEKEKEVSILNPSTGDKVLMAIATLLISGVVFVTSFKKSRK